MKKAFISIFITLFITTLCFAQRPQGGPPGGGRQGGGQPPRDGQMRPGGDMQRDGRPPKGDWMKQVDTNKDGKFDAAELQTAIDTSFAEWDKDGNGTIEANELPRPPKNDGLQGRPNGQGGMRQGPPNGQGGMQQGFPMGQQDDRQQGPDGKKMLPPFFFMDKVERDSSTTKADFERIVRGVFAEMDKNSDGMLSGDESRPPKDEREGFGHPGMPGLPPPPPNAKFIAAELRFGDKLVKGQPFSADTVLEDTRRLYDGTTVTKSNKGAFYRDGAGRTRREQPLEMVGGVSIAGTDGKPQMLVFINDFGTKTQYFLDMNNKVARRHGIGGPPPGEAGTPPDAKTESLGKKTIEGVETEGTRVSFEIPAGQLGNDKPMLVVTENWFSPELQMIVYSRHIDPLAGEHVFKLVNIKRSEPSAELFVVPSGFRVEGGQGRAPEKE